MTPTTNSKHAALLYSWTETDRCTYREREREREPGGQAKTQTEQLDRLGAGQSKSERRQSIENVERSLTQSAWTWCLLGEIGSGGLLDQSPDRGSVEVGVVEWGS